MYSKDYDFMNIELGNMNDERILFNLRHGKYILHPVKHDSILTEYRTEDIAKMMIMNRFSSTTTTLLKKEIIKQ